MQVRKILVCISILSLVSPSLFTTRGLAQNASPPNLQDPAVRSKIAQAKRNAGAVRQVRKVLLDAKVPFDPHILFTRNWRQKIAPHMAQMPEMKKERFQSGVLDGALFADTLHLPEKMSLKGDTVIIANRIVFNGKDVSIKGNHGIHFFAINSMGTAGGGGTVSIDTSGPGRKEWLEQKRQNKVAQQNAREKQNLGRSIGAGGFSFIKASYNFAPAVAAPVAVQNGDGSPGADGQIGLFGYNGSDGTGGPKGADGACAGNVNGQDGGDGGWGTDGTEANDGGEGSPGGNGQPITITITDPNDTTSYSVTSRGGAGGRGGDGGYGGRGGYGGVGGNGGSGAGCACQAGAIGSGGAGGVGGRGGDGGDGGDGGTGGRGGDGDVITINYPSGYDTSRISTDAGGGPGGQGGTAGMGGQNGFGGSGGSAGSAGSVFACATGNNGTPGQRGSDGRGGTHGSHGSPGSPGNPGSVNMNQTGTGPTIEPGGGGGGGGGETPYYYYDSGCTTYYWVYYESYDGGKTWREVDSWYAGCW